MSWHVQSELLERYARGQTDATQAYSIEAHLPSCRQCTGEIAALLDTTRLEHVWERIEDGIDAPRRGPVEAALVRLRVPEHLARLLGATPALRLSWLIACAIVLASAVWAAGRREDAIVVFLILAPLLPLGGVAAAYGPEVDPTYEIGLAAPLPSFDLLLLRALAVLVTTTAMAGLAALALPGMHWSAAAWLLPSLGLTLASIALAAHMPAPAACASLAAVWVLIVIGGWRLEHDPLLVFGIAGQLCCALLAVAGALAVKLNSDRFDRRGGTP